MNGSSARTRRSCMTSSPSSARPRRCHRRQRVGVGQVRVGAHRQRLLRTLRMAHEGRSRFLAVVAPEGRLVALECKTGGATTTKEQRACHAALRAVGVAVHVVRSVDEARRRSNPPVGGRHE